VYDTINGYVSEFNGTTGATIKFHFANFDAPTLLADGHNHLFVPNTSGNVQTIEEFDATSGALLNGNFITGAAYGLALDDNNHLFVGNGNDIVGEYDATTGAAINANFITGLSGELSLAFVPVPEPSSFLLAGTVFLALLICRHSRKRAQAA